MSQAPSSRPARLTLSSCTFVALALTALAGGCSSEALPQPTGEPGAAGLQLPAGPLAPGKTLGEIGFHTAELGAAGTPMYLSGHVAAAIGNGDSASQAVLRSLASAYRLADATNFTVLADEQDATQAGRRFVKLQQVHAGVPVVGGEIVVQVESDGAIGAVLGELVPALRIDPSDPTVVALTGEDAIGRALSVLVRSGSAEVLEPPALRIYALEGNPQLAYRAVVNYLGDSGLVSEELFVSPRDGKVIGQLSRIYTALNRTVYTLKSCLITISGLPGAKNRGEGDPVYSDATVNNVYDHGASTYWFYKNFLNRDSYDNKGAPLRSTVHMTFYAGTSSCSPNNAAWVATAAQMVYGDGDGSVLKDLSLGLDVTAHEITHAVTSSTSNLAYLNESGALNEGMSDVFGSGVHGWKLAGGSDAGNPSPFTNTSAIWLLGADVAGPSLPGGSLRFMDNPTKDGQSKDYYPERYSGSGDNGGVHLNSGILNLVHVLLSDGGKHPRSKTTTQVGKIGIDKSLKIFYLANTQLLTSAATFQLARYASAQAAENLYGRCSPEWLNVHRAWDAVGVLGSWTLCVQPPTPPKF